MRYICRMLSFFFYNLSLQERGPPALSPGNESGQRGHSTRANPGPDRPDQSQPGQASQPLPAPTLPAEALRGSRSSSSSSCSTSSQPEGGQPVGHQPIGNRDAGSLYPHWSGRSASQPISRKMKQQNRSRKFK
jgi:hypothetical protein